MGKPLLWSWVGEESRKDLGSSDVEKSNNLLPTKSSSTAQRVRQESWKMTRNGKQQMRPRQVDDSTNIQREVSQ